MGADYRDGPYLHVGSIMISSPSPTGTEQPGELLDFPKLLISVENRPALLVRTIAQLGSETWPESTETPRAPISKSQIVSPTALGQTQNTFGEDRHW